MVSMKGYVIMSFYAATDQVILAELGRRHIKAGGKNDRIAWGRSRHDDRRAARPATGTLGRCIFRNFPTTGRYHLPILLRFGRVNTPQPTVVSAENKSHHSLVRIHAHNHTTSWEFSLDGRDSQTE